MPTKRPPAPKLYTGTAKTIEAAAELAWSRAKRSGQKAGWYHIVSIEFYADNPIRDYKVQIGGGP
jgi:hypothetical protein